MQRQQITVINKLGLHARAAAKLLKLAERYASQIEIHYKNKKANAKSIMALMLLDASKGAELTVTTDGDDEIEALQAIADLMNNRFGEAE